MGTEKGNVVLREGRNWGETKDKIEKGGMADENRSINCWFYF